MIKYLKSTSHSDPMNSGTHVRPSLILFQNISVKTDKTRNRMFDFGENKNLCKSTFVNLCNLFPPVTHL